MLVRSSLLSRHGFVHAFATRRGGVSKAPFDTLNLGQHLGDEDSAVRENRRRFAMALGVGEDALFQQRQVHGADVRILTAADRSADIAGCEGDGLVSRTAGQAVAARTADCVPVLIAHRASGQVAAVHAGWRGAVAGVVVAAIEAMGFDPAELLVAIGPHIRVAAFEIGEEVAEQMREAAAGAPVVDDSWAKPHGKLAALVEAQLQASGVPRSAIDDVGGCTHDEPERFFSHRRDQGRTGRHLSAIVARVPA
jgi:YfiH family protein